MNEFKKSLGVRWIKADSGKTYLCPAQAVDVDTTSDKQLQSICIDESMNPQNN